MSSLKWWVCLILVGCIHTNRNVVCQYDTVVITDHTDQGRDTAAATLQCHPKQEKAYDTQ